jgi:hypothetical protein
MANYLTISGTAQFDTEFKQFGSQSWSIYHIAIVGYNQWTEAIFGLEWSSIVTGTTARCTVAHVTHAPVTLQAFQVQVIKHIRDQAHSFTDIQVCAIPSCYSGALLTPVLQGV